MQSCTSNSTVAALLQMTWVDGAVQCCAVLCSAVPGGCDIWDHLNNRGKGRKAAVPTHPPSLRLSFQF